MRRTILQFAKMRLVDLDVGDVVSQDPDAATGWFTIDEIRRLPNGDLNVTNVSAHGSLMGSDNDVVSVQVPKVVDLGTPPVAPAPG